MTRALESMERYRLSTQRLRIYVVCVGLTLFSWARSSAERSHVDFPARSAAEVAKVLAEVPIITDVQIAPDGSAVIYQVSRRSVDRNEVMMERLFQGLRQGSDLLPPTVILPFKGRALQWRPDGGAISMVISGPSSKATTKLAIFDTRTRELSEIILKWPSEADGAPLSRTTDPEIMYYQWSPRGRYIALVATTGAKGRLDQRQGVSVKTWKARPRVSLFVLDVSNSECTRLTDDSVPVYSSSGGRISWSPDERQLAFVVTPLDSNSYVDTDLVLVDRETKLLRQLTRRRGMDNSPIWSPDGKWIAFTTQQGKPSEEGGWPGLISPDGSEMLDFAPSNTCGSPQKLTGWWTADSRFFLYQVRREMITRMVRLDPRDGTTELVPLPKAFPPYTDLTPWNWSLTMHRGLMAFTSESITVPQQLCLVAMDAIGNPMGEARPVTTLSDSFPLSKLAQVHKVSWRSRDDKYEIHGLLVMPAETVSRPQLPTVLYNYGGPGMVRTLFGESSQGGALLALAARGYAVLAANTRGRGGYYGVDFKEGAFSRDALDDGLAGIDYLIHEGIANPDQLGIAGHSYGAWYSLFATTQTNRFNASVVHEGKIARFEPEAVSGRNTLGPLAEVFAERSFEDLERRHELIELSPGLNGHKIRTPTLLSYGSRSWADSNGVVMYNILRRYGTPAALFVYDEPHGYHRPAAIADDLTRMGEWLDFWIRGWDYPDLRRKLEYEDWKLTIREWGIE